MNEVRISSSYLVWICIESVETWILMGDESRMGQTI